MIDKNLFIFKGFKAVLAGLLLAALACSGLIILQSLSLASGIAGLAGQNLAHPTQLCFAAFLAAFLLRRLVVLAQESILDRYSLRESNELRSRLLMRVFLEQPNAENEASATKLAHAASDEVPQIAAYLRLVPPKICAIIGISLPLLIAVLVLDWVSGVILLATIPVIGMFMVILGRQAKARAAVQYEHYGKLSNYFIDTLRGLPVLHSFGTTQREAALVHSTSERLRKASMKTIAVATLSGALLDLTATLGIAGIAMMLAMRLLDGSLSLALALAVLILAPEFYSPIRAFASDFHASLDARNALASLLELLEGSSSMPPDKLGPLRWDAHSHLSLSEINLEYAQEDARSSHNAGLHDISLEFHGFERVALIGPSGAGKSSLISVLAGLATPSSGICDANGNESASLQADSWRNLLHLIPQKPWIFRGTLAQNISFYAPNASREDIMGALETVGLEPLVASLPQGIDTLVGEGARELSGGEAHRVALARALLDKRPILLFDEPTAHLDIETELELKKRILPLMEGKLVIFATHRLHWLDSMDRAIFLDDGHLGADAPISKLETPPHTAQGDAQ